MIYTALLKRGGKTAIHQSGLRSVISSNEVGHNQGHADNAGQQHQFFN